MFPSKFLTREDISSPTRAVISDVRMADLEFEGEVEAKPVMRFSDHRLKPMILNRTVVATLSAAYGGDTDAWVNQPIIIYVDPTVMYMGRMVGGLRLRVPDPEPAPGPADPPAKSAPAKKNGGAK